MSNPFVGLRPFRTGEVKLFFGRERETRILANLVLATPVLVLYATSGTGKSSLLNAGLVPELDEDPSLITLVVDDPRKNVNALVRERLSGGGDGADVPGDGGLADIFERHFDATGRRVVLILDQFEEWIKNCATLDELYDDVARLANTRSEAATVVLSIREDYVMSLEPLLHRTVGLLDSSYRVPPLTPDELRDAVKGPLDAVGGKVSAEPGLIDKVLTDLEEVPTDRKRDTRSGESTPGRIEAGFFQVVWHNLWERDAANSGSQLMLRTYEEAGRAEGILHTYVDGILSRLKPDHAEVLHAAIRYLVLPSGAKMPLTAYDLAGFLQEQDFTPKGRRLFSRGDPTAIQSLLTSVLDQLTRSDTALLRRVDDGQTKHELVHDLMGSIRLFALDQISHPIAYR